MISSWWTTPEPSLAGGAIAQRSEPSSWWVERGLKSLSMLAYLAVVLTSQAMRVI